MALLGYGKQSVTPALAGQLDAISRDNAVDSAALSATAPGTCGFGRLVERDGLGKVKLYDGTGVVAGLTLRDDTREQAYLANTGAPYVTGDAVPFLRRGRAWLWTGNSASTPLVVGTTLAEVISSEVIAVAQDPNGDRLALVDINIPVA